MPVISVKFLCCEKSWYKVMHFKYDLCTQFIVNVHKGEKECNVHEV